MSFQSATRLDPDEDRRLVERCLDGDARAWEALVRRHERLVYAVARTWRLSDEDAGDVFQEVFAALVRGLPRLRDGRALVRWLASTTERVARAAALRARRVQATTPGVEPERLAEIAAEQPEVGADLERLERQALVRLAMDALGGRCRELLAALYYEDPAPPYAELAVRLHMPIGSLGPTRARCFQRMREALARLAGGADVGISEASGPTSDRGGSEEEPQRRRDRTAPRTRRLGGQA